MDNGKIVSTLISQSFHIKKMAAAIEIGGVITKADIWKSFM